MMQKKLDDYSRTCERNCFFLHYSRTSWKYTKKTSFAFAIVLKDNTENLLKRHTNNRKKTSNTGEHFVSPLSLFYLHKRVWDLLPSPLCGKPWTETYMRECVCVCVCASHHFIWGSLYKCARTRSRALREGFSRGKIWCHRDSELNRIYKEEKRERDQILWQTLTMKDTGISIPSLSSNKKIFKLQKWIQLLIIWYKLSFLHIWDLYVFPMRRCRERCRVRWRI